MDVRSGPEPILTSVSQMVERLIRKLKATYGSVNKVNRPVVWGSDVLLTGFQVKGKPLLSRSNTCGCLSVAMDN